MGSIAKSRCSASDLSASSNIIAVTVKPGCPVIQNLVLSHPACHGFTASWNADDCVGLGLANYQLLIKKNGATSFVGYNVGSNNNATVNWLLPGVTYNVAVMSVVCNGATSGYSATQNITTSVCREAEEAEEVKANETAANREAITIYPNPAQGQFWVNIGSTDNREQTVKIELINQLGQTVQTNISGMNNGHLNELVNIPNRIAAGIYFGEDLNRRNGISQ